MNQANSVPDVFSDGDLNSASEVRIEPTQGNNERPVRARQPPTRFADIEFFTNNEISNYGDLVHFALCVGSEPVSFEEAIGNKALKEAVLEELNSIEKNQTWLSQIYLHGKSN